MDSAPSDKDSKTLNQTQEPQTRRQQMLANRIEPRLPEINCADHLVSFLFEAGPCSAAAMGEIPLTSSDLLAWCDGSGFALNSWEFRTIRRLSAEFLAQKQKSTKPDCPAPYIGTEAEQNRDAVSRQIANVFGARIARQTRKKG